MNFFRSVLALSAMVFIASPALAAVTYTVDATTSDQSPLSSVTPGAKLILNITVRTTDFAIAIEGSVNDYDATVVAFDVASSAISTNFFNDVCYAPNACFNGLSNIIGGAIPFAETASGPNQEVAFMAALSSDGTGASGDGSLDQAPDGSGSGAPQFEVVFDVIGALGTSTTLDIGTFEAFGDGYTGTADSDENNTSVTITVPEPASVATSLAAVSSVFCVVAIRRRLL